MIDIQIDERSVFTYSFRDKCIGIWHHRDGRFKGPVIGPCAFISFKHPDLIYALKEQLDLLLEKIEAKKGELLYQLDENDKSTL